MSPKKRFGQNFLVNEKISSIIAEKSDIDEKIVFEIGPGKGALSKHLLKRVNHLYAFEIDKELYPYLKRLEEKYDHFTLFFEDILNIDLNAFIKDHNLKDISCVANIPYNITGPLLTKLKDIKEIKSLTLMVQKEVADRLLSKPHTKTYGQLSVIFQYYFDIKKIVDVKRTDFFPVPKVLSTVIKMDRKEITEDERFLNRFYEFVRASFSQKRKTLVNNLAASFHLKKDEVIKRLNIKEENLLIRAENISVSEFIRFLKDWYHD